MNKTATQMQIERERQIFQNQQNAMMSLFQAGYLSPEKLLEIAGFNKEEIDKIIEQNSLKSLNDKLCEILPK